MQHKLPTTEKLALALNPKGKSNSTKSFLRRKKFIALFLSHNNLSPHR
jgi:hypothetical protein